MISRSIVDEITLRSSFAGLSSESELADDQGFGSGFSDDGLVHGSDVGAIDEVFLDLDVLIVVGWDLFLTSHPVVDVEIENSGHRERISWSLFTLFTWVDVKHVLGWIAMSTKNRFALDCLS